MIRKLFAAAVLVAMVVLAVAPAGAAHSATGTYTIGTTPGLSIVCSPDCLGESGLNIGGYTFDVAEGEGEVPAKVVIADASGGPVSFTVCQDFNGALCGERDRVAGVDLEPRIVGCGTEADLSTSAVPFTADVDTSIFIRFASHECPGGIAAGGTITITYGA